MFIPIERPLDTKVIQFYLQSCSLSVSRLSSCVNISLPCFINIRFQMFKKNVDYFSIIFFLYGPLASISLEWRRFPSSLRRRRQKHKKKNTQKKWGWKKKKLAASTSASAAAVISDEHAAKWRRPRLFVCKSYANRACGRRQWEVGGGGVGERGLGGCVPAERLIMAAAFAINWPARESFRSVRWRVPAANSARRPLFFFLFFFFLKKKHQQTNDRRWPHAPTRVFVGRWFNKKNIT